MKHKLFFAILALTSLIIFSSCTKDPEPLIPPVADAGNFQIVQLPVIESQVTLTGSGTATNPPIKGYLWSLVSGPNVPVIASPSSTSTKIDNLIAGTYIMQFEVTDNAGLTGVDTVSIIVKPSVAKTLSIQPANNPFEGYIDTYYPNNWFTNTEIPIGAWTSGGYPETYRECIKFDFGQIPAGSVIDSAKLFLFAIPTPLGGNVVDAHYGPANQCFVQRITSTWSSALNPFTWNNPPSVTTTNQAIIPKSASSFQDNVIDVTALVKDMIPVNNGFLIRLQTENTYNIRQYASSYFTDASKHPKLVISYH